ncbi:MNIO family bufferin maturase [Sphingomonas sp. UYP23]
MTMTTGLGFKLEHLDEALTARNLGLWFEVHAENYMVEGGPRLRALVALAERFPIALHGVGLSLASVEPPSADHLRRLKALSDLIRPAAVSDHLAWQKWEGAHHADFLPFPRTREALDITVANVARVQDALGRTIMVENPSLYVELPGHDFGEASFLTELARRTGCGLLVDVNNIYVSAANLRFSADARVDAIPASIVGEIHLAGHRPDPDQESGLLIDSHDAPISDPVWMLYRRLIERIGPRPTLIERDDDIPPFAALMRERDRAHHLLEYGTTIDA